MLALLGEYHQMYCLKLNISKCTWAHFLHFQLRCNTGISTGSKFQTQGHTMTVTMVLWVLQCLPSTLLFEIYSYLFFYFIFIFIFFKLCHMMTWCGYACCLSCFPLPLSL